jgi:hypothetical protein
MADEKNTNVTIKARKDAVKDLISAAFAELAKRAEPQPGQQSIIFFPNGIELISFTVKVSEYTVELKVAGAAGVKALLEIEEIGKVAKEVTEEQ